jgi:hypothetical protein
MHVEPGQGQPLTWLALSALLGLLVFAAVQVALWRPLPVLGEAPTGSFAQHAGYWLRGLIHSIAPNLFASDWAYYQKTLAEMSQRAGSVSFWGRIGLGAALALAPACLLAPVCLTPREGQLHIRGSRRFEGKAAPRELAKQLGASNKRRPDHPIHPEVPYPADQWTRHVLIVGGVGSGKSTVLRPLIARVIAANEKLILFDPKGEFTAGFKQPILLAPWDRRSWSWDIAKDLRNIGDIRRFAAALIKEGKDPMWSNASRQVLTGYLVCLKEQRGSLWGWKELAQMLATPEEDLLAIMERYNPEAIRAVEKASVTTTGILINLAAFCSPIFDLATAWGDTPENRRVSFIEWAVAEGPAARQVILQGNGAYPELTQTYIEGIVGALSALINSVEIADDPARKLWIIADEFGQMGKVPIKALFEVGRSRGVRCVVACQDFAQLEEIHGKDTLKALVSMSGSLLVGRVGPGETAENLSKVLGSREVERANVSSSYNGGSGAGGRASTFSYSRDELALYKPNELASRLGEDAARGGCALALATQGTVYELFWPYAELKAQRAAYEPAPWVFGRTAPAALKAERESRSTRERTGGLKATPSVAESRNLEAAPVRKAALPQRSREETLVTASHDSSTDAAREKESAAGVEVARLAGETMFDGAGAAGIAAVGSLAMALDAMRERKAPAQTVTRARETKTQLQP